MRLGATLRLTSVDLLLGERWTTALRGRALEESGLCGSIKRRRISIDPQRRRVGGARTGLTVARVRYRGITNVIKAGTRFRQ
jgi:hypothetical protein